jgi:hypothetical protein
MTMLANTAIAVEHRHHRSPDIDALTILLLHLESCVNGVKGTLNSV